MPLKLGEGAEKVALMVSWYPVLPEDQVRSPAPRDSSVPLDSSSGDVMTSPGCLGGMHSHVHMCSFRHTFPYN